VFEKLYQLLQESNARFRVIHHPAEGQSERVAQVRGTDPGQGAKAMLCRVKERPDLLVLAILPATRKSTSRSWHAPSAARRRRSPRPRKLPNAPDASSAPFRLSLFLPTSRWSSIPDCLIATRKSPSTPVAWKHPSCSIRSITRESQNRSWLKSRRRIERRREALPGVECHPLPATWPER
jgi:hypothetical protein